MASAKTNSSGPANVESYLAAQPPDFRAALEAIRRQIKAACPKGEEVISYGVPAFRYEGALVGYGAAKAHCAFYVMSPATVNAHASDLAKYDVSPGAIRFSPDRPLPATLVKKLVKARMAENEKARLATAARKAKKPAAKKKA